MEDKAILVQEKNIESLIYSVRDKQVMLDVDVARLYQVETKRINEVIKRNINRFPQSFCFQLTKEEVEKLSLRSQIATLNKGDNLRGRHFKYLPYVLTEQGIMMLSGLLRSDVAVKINIQIIEAFVKMRKYFASEALSENILIDHENRILRLENLLSELGEEETNKIFFEGELYDAHSLFIDIINKSKNEIIIIDNYAGKELMDILKKLDRRVIVISKNIDDALRRKYESQYDNTTFAYSSSFHDRFIILDREILYHCGASFKDLGRKCFAINKIKNQEILDKLINLLKLPD